MLCEQCHADKALDAFRPNKRYKTGYHPVCAQCTMANLPTALICQECGSEKPVKAFRTKKASLLGYRQPCLDCYAQAKRNDRAANPEGTRAKARIRYGQHTTKIIAQVQASYERHGEKRRARARKRYADDPERFQQEARERRAADPEKAREQRRTAYRTNPTKVRLVYSRRQARKRGLPDTFTRSEYTFMLQYWSYGCAVCGQQEGLFGLTLVPDHWIPLAAPECPGTVATNMLPLCHGTGGCNSSKKHKEGKQWLIQRYGPAKAARILKRIETYFALVRVYQRDEQGAAD